ncbi:MAG TPA: putative phosphothreonine lyase domain-containing protein, partial [Ktedonobacteraceae bacterium]
APLCVYTKNFEDHDDVLRVLCGLRDAGVDQRVAYKSDEMTLSGMKGSLWYSPAHTRLMQRPKAYQGRPPYRYG